MLENFSLPRWYFLNASLSCPNDNVEFQLHGFSDASNLAFSSVIYLRRLVSGIPVVWFVLINVTLSWLISSRDPLIGRSSLQL